MTASASESAETRRIALECSEHQEDYLDMFHLSNILGARKSGARLMLCTSIGGVLRDQGCASADL